MMFVAPEDRKCRLYKRQFKCLQSMCGGGCLCVMFAGVPERSIYLFI